MEFPFHGDYNSHVKHLNIFVLDSRFKGGIPCYTKQGTLMSYSGGYSKVYPVKVQNKILALRCWLKDIGEAKDRYEKTKSYLDANPIPYFVEFGYTAKGILVNGQVYPIIHMEWVSGLPLNKFLDENIRNTQILLQIADKFVEMVKALHNRQISHGDLQNGNILIVQNGHSPELKLIDYDSLYTPTLKGWSDTIAGVQNYQHPSRKYSTKSGEKTDYFSELVIYLSLLVYAEKPELWKSGKQEESLLFSYLDYDNPSNSNIFKQLRSSKFSSKVQYLTTQLENFCLKPDFADLSPLEVVLTGNPTSQINIPITTTPSLSLEMFGVPAPTSPRHGLSWDSFSPGQNPSVSSGQVNPKPTSVQKLDGFFGSVPSVPPPPKMTAPSTTPVPPSITTQKASNVPSLVLGMLSGFALLYAGAFAGDMSIQVLNWIDNQILNEMNFYHREVALSSIGVMLFTGLAGMIFLKRKLKQNVSILFSLSFIAVWLFVGYYYIQFPSVEVPESSSVKKVVEGIESLYWIGLVNWLQNILQYIVNIYIG